MVNELVLELHRGITVAFEELCRTCGEDENFDVE